MNPKQYLGATICSFLLFLTSTTVLAEGTAQLSPTDTNIVLLHTNATGFGDFASYDGDSLSRLHIRISDFTSEVLYLGLSAEANSDGVINSSYWFRIKDPDGVIVHGPFQVTEANQNASTWDLATAGPDVLNPGTGYNTAPLYATFDPSAVMKNGDYYIEFSESATMDIDNIVNVKWFDFTVVSNGITEEPGRVWSNRWALRTPEETGAPPECEWDRAFNGSFYTYTMDGFVSLIDFENSGFQGLSFTVAFGATGPGNTGDVIEDRKSVNMGDSTASAADHMVFLNEPDEILFPSSTDLCGDVSFLDVTCEGDSICILVGVTQMGQVELLLDFFGNNGMFDPGTTDVLIARMFEEADTACIYWNKLKGDGSPLTFSEPVPAVITYSQGVQHYAAFDVEFLKNGFCTQTIRPICSAQSNLLYWDDSNITDIIATPFIDESDPGTGQPLVQLSGCLCGVAGCRTWTNFQTGSDPNDCDGTPAGYGDFRTLNTWWFASSISIGPFDIPVVRAQVAGETLICFGDSTNFSVLTNPDSLAYTYSWSGPGGFSANTPMSGFVSEPGTYSVTITDPESGCSAADSIELMVASQLTTTISFICLGGNSPNADVDLSVGGGTPPYMYSWSNGETTQDLMDVPPGTYTVTVTDDLGCTTVDSVTVQGCCDLTILCPDMDGGTFACDSDIPAADTSVVVVTEFCSQFTIDVVESDNAGSGCSGNPFVLTRTYIVQDGEGNTDSCTQIFTVIDDQMPVIDAMSCPADTSILCNNPIGTDLLGFPVYIDNCSPDVTVTFDDDSIGFDGSCDMMVLGEVHRTFIATDACGNVNSSCVQIISIIDTVPPVIQVPPDVTLDCTMDTLPSTTGMVEESGDNCSGVTVTFSDLVVPGDCPAVDTVYRTWMGTDACGNITQSVQVITRIDDTPPQFTTPADVTLDCTIDPDPAVTGDVTDATDDCTGTMVNFSDTVVPGVCPATDTIYREWTVTDGCGNVSSDIQIITLLDDTPPSFTVPPDVEIPCDADTSPSNTGDVTDLSDACSTPTIDFSDEVVPGTCPVIDTIFRTWIAVDDCNNSLTQVQIITTVDMAAPVITPGTCPPDTTIACGTDIGDFGMPSFTDNCSIADITFQDDSTGFVPPSVEGTVTRTFIITDACGNVNSSCVQVITVVDTVPPELICPADVSVDCGASTDPAATGNPIITDNCGDPQDLMITITDDSTGFTATCNAGVITRTFVVEDPDGNISTCVQIITVVDNSAPTFNVPPDITVDCDIDFTDLGLLGNISNVQDCSEPVDTTFMDVFGMIGCDGTGEIIRTWSVTDGCGNTGTGIQMIMVQDTVPPDLQPPPDVTIDCTEDPQDTSVTGSIVVITDECSMMFMLEYEDDLSGLTGCSGTGVIIRTWNATDECDNLAVMQQVITVVDNTPPVPLCQDITLDFDENPVLSITPDQVDNGSFDECGDVTLSLSQSTFDCIEFRDEPTQPFDLIVTDECGNTSSCVFNITGVGGGGIILECPSDIFRQLGSGECETVVNYNIEATRRCGTEEPVLVQTDDSGFTSGDIFPIGTYQQSYIAYNSMGDTLTCSFTITIVENIQSSNTLVCNDDINISLDQDCASFINPDMILEGGDFGCFDDFLVEVEGVGGGLGGVLINDDNVVIGNTYTVTVTDTKTGISCWSVILVEDKIPPEVECEDRMIFCTTPLEPVFATPDTQFLPYAPVATDQCGSVSYAYQDQIFESVCGIDSVYRHWRISDGYGNVTECLQRIFIMTADLEMVEIPPTYFGSCNDATPPSITGWPTIMGYPITLNPSCNVMATYEDLLLDDCGGGSKIVRKWTIINTCDQSFVRGDQAIKLSDLEGPVLTCPPDVTMNADPWFCARDIAVTIPGAYDDCESGFSLTVEAGELNDQVTGSWPTFVIQDMPLGTWPVTWVATDECGNVSECTYFVTIIDEVPPVAACEAHTIVSLGNDPGIENGLTKVAASVFDDGSYDNCTDVSFRARRMSSCIDFDWTTNGAGVDEIPNGIVNARDRGMSFAEYVPFACCDVGAGPIMIELSVEDEFGNFSLCMVEVEVDDKLRPYLECPPDIILSCDYWFDVQETDGFVSLEDDVTTPLFGRVLDAHEYAQSDRQSIIIDDPGNDELPQPYNWGLEGWADDNCDVDISVRVRIFDDCSGDLPGVPPAPHTVRLVERTFRADDGVTQPRTCVQRIWVVDYDPFYISDETCVNADPNDGVIWPCDEELVCTDEIPVNYPETFDDNCSLIGVTFDDERFDFVDDACFKILRTWTVIDWCQYNPETNAGLWTHLQVIKVVDVDGAVFTDCPDEPITFCVADSNVQLPENNQVFLGADDPNSTSCSAHLQLEHTVTEFCSDFVIYDVKVYPFDGSGFVQIVGETELQLDTSGQAVLTMDTRNAVDLSVRNSGLPYNDAQCVDGELQYHRVLWSVEDGCGNVSTCSYLFRLEDCKAPSPVCLSLSTVVMPSSGEVTLWAIDFDASSFDDCTPAEELLFSFSGDVYQPSRTFSCEDLDTNGGPSFVFEIWVADNGNDLNCNGFVEPLGIEWSERNKDYCTTFIFLDDTEEVCGPMENAGGVVKTELEETVELVSVDLLNAQGDVVATDVTGDDGTYVFVNPLLDYTIVPSRGDEPENGVTTMDLVRLQQHLLGVSPFESPYQMIAADVNNSKSVTATDLIEIRKLVLGTTEEFPDNPSWRFVPADFVFTEVTHPWPFDEVIELQSGITMNEDFVGMKIGDVNGTVVANAQNIEVRVPDDTLRFIIQDLILEVQDKAMVQVSAENFDNILGFQLTLEHDGLRLIDVEPGTLDMSMSNAGVHGSMSALSWHIARSVSIADDEILFTLVFEAMQATKLSESFGVSAVIATPEAYRGKDLMDEHYLNVEFEFGVGPNGKNVTDYSVYQNAPNPFDEYTTIGFDLPESTEVVITVMDAAGKLMMEKRGVYPEGYNVVRLDGDDLNTNGLFYYRIEADGFSATKKMVRIK